MNMEPANLTDFILAVDEDGLPFKQDENLLLVNSSGEFVAVEDTQRIRDFYGIITQPPSNLQLSPLPSTSQSSAIQHTTHSPTQSSDHHPPAKKTKFHQHLNLDNPTTSLQYCQLPSTSSQPVQNYKKGQLRWTHSATLQLIEEWRQRRYRFANNTERNEALWEEISTAMRRNNFDFSSHQVENKFKYLKKSYTDCVDANKKSTGEPEKFCNYFEEMHQLFGSSPQIQPLALVASRDLDAQDGPRNISNFPVEQPENSSRDEEPMTESSAQASQAPRRRTRMERTVGRWAEEFRVEAQQREEARDRRHQELMQLLRESNDMFERLTERLIKKL